MRIALLAAVLLAACLKPQAAAPPVVAGIYAGGGRDSLCVATSGAVTRAGFIVYGPDNANCSASGRLEPSGAAWTLVPTGDAECRIPLDFNDGKVMLGKQSGACAYYCGPGASFDGKGFARTASGPAAVDLAGDPLC
jgi:hypothetical protein